MWPPRHTPAVQCQCSVSLEGIVGSREALGRRDTHVLGLLLSLFAGTRTTFPLRSASACCEASLVE